MSNFKFLVTGTSSGLGKYLLEKLEGVPFRRNSPYEIENNREKFYDCIIHCAADTRNIIPANELWNYYLSNIELARKLTTIQHDLFVYISSPAVYPNTYYESSETDVPDFPTSITPIHHTYYLYGLFKLLAEQMVFNSTKRSLILRCVSIVGPTSRSTNIIRVLRNDPSPLTLSGDSSFNLVSMSQIKEFIELAMAKKITGIFNAGSTKNATLKEIAEAVESKPTFGNFKHDVHRMNTAKIRSISREFDKSSLEIAKEARLIIDTR
jgi:nucleoside-diphosphate-sugar epimerase